MLRNRETLFASIAAVFMFSTVIAFGAARLYAHLPVDSTNNPDESSHLGDIKGTTREPIAVIDNQIVATRVPATPTPTLIPSTDTPTASPEPTETTTPTPTNTATRPLPTATPQTVNGLSELDFIVMPQSVRTHVRGIFDQGQRMGRNPRAFSRLGASIVDTRFFLTRWDLGPYELGDFDYLQPTIKYFNGSFERIGVATKRGLSAGSVFDPMWANRRQCQANENMVDCEIRLHNPTILLIILGTNDIGSGTKFQERLADLVQHIIDQGIVPVLATKADRYEGRDNRNNKIIRDIADQYRIPLWDYDLLSGTIPGRGLGNDNVHMTVYEQYDYTLPKAFQRGYGLYNLSALMTLDAVRQVILQNGDNRPDPSDLIG
jgi:hypothetical protein